VQAVTGSGKTMLAIRAIQRLQEKYQSRLYVVVVVPTKALQQQWNKAFVTFAAQQDAMVEIRHQIYVINSARYKLARQILKVLKQDCNVFLIADECHRYTGAENRRIFEFEPLLPECPGDYFALGLSATIQDVSILRVLEPAMGRLVYCYPYERALSEGVISEFVLFQIALNFTPREREEYENLTEEMRRVRSQLYYRYPLLKKPGISFFAILQDMAKDGDETCGRLARTYLQLSYSRKRQVCMARRRILCACRLVECLDLRKKLIVFSESVEQADTLYDILKSRYRGKIGRYHSKAGRQANQNALDRFRNGELYVLIACKALDEGVNVPDAAIGIVLSGTGIERQRIQRLGRILRKSGEKSFACLYYLYVQESAEEKTYFPLRRENFRAEDLEYTDTGEFIYPGYEQAAASLLKWLVKENADEAMLAETERHLEAGKVRGDWLLNAERLRQRESCAETRSERNYWITMRRLAKAGESQNMT